MLVDDVLKPTPEDELEEEVDPRLLENIDKQARLRLIQVFWISEPDTEPN